MKLTVVPPDRSEDIVPKISEYANTQNKVNAADFFSNHPFHIRIEQFSRNVIFTAREGERHDTKWFYERSRGQFINARARLTSAQQKKFDLEFPKSQLFSKTDLAKFEFSATGEPHLVSRGAQKNFAEFAKNIGEAWSRSDARYDELWYKRLISKAIVFRWLETEVPKQPWYEGAIAPTSSPMPWRRCSTMPMARSRRWTWTRSGGGSLFPTRFSAPSCLLPQKRTTS